MLVVAKGNSSYKRKKCILAWKGATARGSAAGPAIAITANSGIGLHLRPFTVDISPTLQGGVDVSVVFLSCLLFAEGLTPAWGS